MATTTAFESILYADTKQDIKQDIPAFFQDLHLDYLLETIEASAKGYDIRPFYYTLPSSIALIQYRQQICEDLSDDTLYDCVKTFCSLLQKSRQSYELSLESEGVIQSATYHLEAATTYWNSLLEFECTLDSCKLSSDGMIALQKYVKEHMAALKEMGFEAAITRANEFFSQMRFQLTIEEDRITITEENTSPNNCLQNLTEVLAKILPDDVDSSDSMLRRIFPNALEPSYLEGTLINILRKSNPSIFQEIRAFHKAFPNFYSEKLLCFDEEVQFYLCFLDFKRKTEALGHSFCIPHICAENEFYGSGIYDLALAWKNSHSNYNIISNDFNWSKAPSFFVVTGPNQGGKTTFARSIGQAVYLSMIGLYANGTALTLPVFEDILTHFEAEEVLQSNSGKLKEEINRLKPMMHQDKKRCFVILNELFTTATTHDALIMGRKVMNHFLAKECYGIYVTHIQELAEETDSIISLVAQVEADDDNKRTYRILPMKAQGYGYSDTLVKQFHLNYEDIIRRLS